METRYLIRRNQENEDSGSSSRNIATGRGRSREIATHDHQNSALAHGASTKEQKTPRSKEDMKEWENADASYEPVLTCTSHKFGTIERRFSKQDTSLKNTHRRPSISSTPLFWLVTDQHFRLEVGIESSSKTWMLLIRTWIVRTANLNLTFQKQVRIAGIVRSLAKKYLDCKTCHWFKSPKNSKFSKNCSLSIYTRGLGLVLKGSRCNPNLFEMLLRKRWSVFGLVSSLLLTSKTRLAYLGNQYHCCLVVHEIQLHVRSCLERAQSSFLLQGLKMDALCFYRLGNIQPR